LDRLAEPETFVPGATIWLNFISQPGRIHRIERSPERVRIALIGSKKRRQADRAFAAEENFWARRGKHNRVITARQIGKRFPRKQVKVRFREREQMQPTFVFNDEADS